MKTKFGFIKELLESKLIPSNPYGFTTEIHQVKPDDYIEISVWKKGSNDKGVIALDGGSSSDMLIDR